MRNTKFQLRQNKISFFFHGGDIFDYAFRSVYCFQIICEHCVVCGAYIDYNEYLLCSSITNEI